MAVENKTRQRHPGKDKNQDSPQKIKKSKKQHSEDEAVSKASNRWITHFLLALVLSLVLPFLVLILLPSPVQPKEYPKITPPPPFSGALSPNNLLASVEKLYHKKVVGPESLIIDGDRIYTGTIDGWVNVLHNGKVRRLVRFGQEPCGGFENETTCGRPLGLRVHRDGHLIVCDAYHGLFKVNVTTGEYETLHLATTMVSGRQSKLLNDLDIDEQGRIYFTDSSTKWHRNQFFHLLMEGDDTGRLLMYDPKSRQTEQLVGGLIFPNGVQLTPDGSGVLVAELGRARILKYNLKSKAFSVWVDGLPGNPDNIRYDSSSQTYWVGMGLVRYTDQISLVDFLATKPWLRGILAKVIDVSNLQQLRELMKMVKIPQPQALAVELNLKGEVVSSLQDLQGDVVKAVSEVHVAGGHLYMGSYHQNFIARLDKKK